MTGKSQALACCLSVVATFLSLAPIELQRRMIDDAIGVGDAGLLLVLAAVYAASVIALQMVKLWLGVLQGWMSESAVAYTRSHLWRLRGGEADAINGEGRDIVSVLTTETEALGGFAGVGPSQFISNATMLLGALGYMFWVEPLVAIVGLALILPQALLAPVMQRRLNRLVAIRLRQMRRLTASIDRSEPPDEEEMRLRLKNIFRNRMSFFWWKFLMKSALNFLNGIAPLGVIVAGGWLVISGGTTLGVIVAFVGGFSRLGDPIRQLIAFYREAAQAQVRHDMIAGWMTKEVKASS